MIEPETSRTSAVPQKEPWEAAAEYGAHVQRLVFEQAKASVRGRPQPQGDGTPTPRWEPEHAADCRCPLCERDRRFEVAQHAYLAACRQAGAAGEPTKMKQPKGRGLTKAERALVRQAELPARLARQAEKRDARKRAVAERRAARKAANNVPADQRTRAAYLARRGNSQA